MELVVVVAKYLYIDKETNRRGGRIVNLNINCHFDGGASSTVMLINELVMGVQVRVDYKLL